MILGKSSKKIPDTVRSRKSRNAKASVQRFLPIAEIRNDTVLLKNGGLRAVLQVEPLNFNLKSETEQQGIIAGYQSFVNTLTFPIQIVIRSTKINIDPYMEQIRLRAQQQENPLLKTHMESYSRFIERIVEVADIMQKRFFVVVPLDDLPSAGEKQHSFLAKLLSFGSSSTDDSASKAAARFRSFATKSAALKDRVLLVQSGLHNVGLNSRRLTTQELIELYYHIYNPKSSQQQKLKGRDPHTASMTL